MLARMGSSNGGGIPARLPSWLSEEGMAYVVEQFKHHGFRGGVNYCKYAAAVLTYCECTANVLNYCKCTANGCQRSFS
jgi:hypothetical protein